MEMITIKPDGYLLQGDDIRYPTPNDVHLRLVGTIITWDGTPMYCNGNYDGHYIQLTPLEKEPKESFIVHANDTRLDIKSLRIGYLNYKDRGYYVRRRPIRSQRQGLDIRRLTFYSINNGENTSFGVDSEVLGEFGKMLCKDYPKVADVVQRRSAGLSRTWGLRRTDSPEHYIVFHRTEAVGIYRPSIRQFNILPDKANPLRLNSLSKLLSKQDGVCYAVNVK